MRKKHVKVSHWQWLGLVVGGVILGLGLVVVMAQGISAKDGFDEFGYNYRARAFQGDADGTDRKNDGLVWGDPTYANDVLVMKWSREWDAARFDGKPWSCRAWTSNQWNGKQPDGSGETWQYKIVWVGPELQDSECWREGGYPIWGEFEVIMSHGSVANDHFWDAHAQKAGYGLHK